MLKHFGAPHYDLYAGLAGAIRLHPEFDFSFTHVPADLTGFLMQPPGNRLEALHGDRQGQCSIRINDQWRICFKWVDGDGHEVEIVDYH